MDIRSTSPGAAAPEGTDALELLKQDHKSVQMLFNQFEAMRNAGLTDASRKLQLVRQICLELTVHAQIEEELFYPAMRRALEQEDQVDEAEEEHAEAKELIVELQQMDAGDPQMDATMLALAKVVLSHVHEEECELFTEARGRFDAAALGPQLLQRKQSLQQQLCLQMTKA